MMKLNSIQIFLVKYSKCTWAKVLSTVFKKEMMVLQSADDMYTNVMRD